MEEIWKSLAAFGHSRYEVSNLGRFRRVRTKTIKASHIHYRTGYPFISLINDFQVRPFKKSKSGYSRPKSTTHLASKLISTTFLGPCPEGKQIDHINRDKTDNRVSNFRYVTQSENIRNRDKPKYRYVRAYSRATYDRIWKLWETGHSQVQIGKKIGCNNSTVSKIVNGKIKCRYR